MAFAVFGLYLLIAACNPSTSTDEKNKMPDSTAVGPKSDSTSKSASATGGVIVSDGDSEQAEGDSID